MADWDERYRSGEYANLVPSELLSRAISGVATGAALDLACGAGRHALYLAENGWRVTAVDSSVVGVDLLRTRARERDLSIDAWVTDLEQGEFDWAPHTYDLICDLYYLQLDLFPKIRISLKPGGLFVAAIHLAGPDRSLDNTGHRFVLESGELLEYFNDWEILHYYETKDIDTDAGQHHRPTSELIARYPTIQVGRKGN
ncbi:MAG: methyltransferase domain-containing protein [Pyrinomonadaceae bacterium]